MNIVVEYLYRDAANNKIWGEALFSNESNLGKDDLLYLIRSRLIDGEFFVAEKSGVASLCFNQYDPELDHGWHEFYDIKLLHNQFDSCTKDIMQFISNL